MLSKALTRWFGALALAAALPAQSIAAEVIIFNGDPPGVGFNDPTPAAPIGGNPGTTRGQQALNVFQRAADIWGQRLQSDQTINVIAFFTPLSCTPTSGVLGAAAANWFFRDAPAAPGGKGMTPGTWHHGALAEKLTKTDLTTAADPDDFFEIFTLFNSELGKPGCLDGSGWYFGLDNQQPSNLIDLLAVVLHEFGHGLGFSLGTTSANTGARPGGFPSVWEANMYDVTTGKTWLTMTNAERAASARNDRNLVWIGLQANNNVRSVLDRAIILNATGVSPILPNAATFGGQVSQAPGQKVSASLTAPNDGGGVSLLDGCEAYSGPTALAGQIALVNRGNCTFAVKAQNAQAAGAAALLIANNAAGAFSPGGAAPDVTIPVFGVTMAEGAALRAAVGSGPVVAQIGASAQVRAGTTAGYPRLFAPTAFAQGSSVSHWDVSMTPSVLMEPSITSELTSSVKNPEDLTRGLLRDIGW
jgi:hypothetical protein